MAEKIEVGYTLVPIVGGLGIYHEYILYTNSAGEQFYARGGPDTSLTSELGTIDTQYGVYDENTPDWDPSRDPTNPDPNAIPHPRETIIVGDDLTDYWQTIKDVMSDIMASHKKPARRKIKKTRTHCRMSAQGGDMKGFNVSMIPSLPAFASGFPARQMKNTAQGRVNAPSHALSSGWLLNIQTSIPSLRIRQGQFRYVHWGS